MCSAPVICEPFVNEVTSFQSRDEKKMVCKQSCERVERAPADVIKVGLPGASGSPGELCESPLMGQQPTPVMQFPLIIVFQCFHSASSCISNDK